MFVDAARAKDMERMKIILQEKPSAIGSKDPADEEKSAIHVAVETKDYDMLRWLIKQPLVDINISDVFGQSALFNAIKTKDLDLVKFLIEECNFNIEHLELQERTPLYYACSIGALNIVEYLISKEADVNAMTRMGRTAISKTCWNGEYETLALLVKHPKANFEMRDS